MQTPGNGWIGRLSLVWTILFVPSAGFAQPGRTFTPPPPPPMIQPPPRIQTFTPPPMIHNQAPVQMQHTQMNNQMMQNQFRIQQQMNNNIDQMRNFQQQSQQMNNMIRTNPAYRTPQQGGGFVGAGGMNAGAGGLGGGINNVPAVPGQIPNNAGVQGVHVTGVQVGSIAAKLGLRGGDILLSLNGQQLRNNQHFKDLRRQQQAGDPPAQMVVLRNGEAITLAVPQGVLGVWLKGQ